MTTRQAQIAATLINAIYQANTNTPGQVEGFTDKAVNKIRAASRTAARRTLTRLNYGGPQTAEGAVRFALDNY